MRSSQTRVAVLGAGIMGVSLALFLARRGFEVSLFDRENAPLACASRWNEGKIHLGYLYGADLSLRTARHILPGGLAFGRLLSELVSTDITPHVTQQDDIYLVHRRSVVDAETLRTTFSGVSALIRDHAKAGQYLVDVSAARALPLSPREIEAIADREFVVAGFRIPERSVNTNWIADELCAAVTSEPRISLRMRVTITDVHPVDSVEGSWRLRGAPDVDERFSLVVNALWNGRLAIDSTAGLVAEAGWSHRYRRCLFVRTRRDLAVHSTIVCVGPFGDVKNYNGRDFYLSWYPIGLISESSAISPVRPEPLTAEGKERFVSEVCAGLQSVLPSIAPVLESAEAIIVEGGFVFAQGKGSIGDPKSSLHRRHRFGIRRLGNYISVDTGKYSTAPWMARNLAVEICGN